jgi:hypothetical protein
VVKVCPLKLDEQSVKDVTVNESLTVKQKDEVHELLTEFSDVFTTKPGKTTLVKHEIRLTTCDPVRAKSYPVPYSVRETIGKEIEEMGRMGVIRKSKSPYSAPPVIVKKPDGSNRFCVNYMKLNLVTIFDSEPMPDPEEIYMKMKGKRFRTKLDMSKGYWQITMDPESIEKTAFSVPQGHFEFVRMPFGLKNSAASFNRLIRKVLGDLEDVECFVDDVQVFNDTWEEHMCTLRLVFTRLREAGLTAKPSKAMVGFTDIEYVGHEVGLDTLKPRDGKRIEILAVDRPRTKRQVKAFLAMVGYNRRFIPIFSDLAEPLNSLLTKKCPNVVIWGPEQQRTFDVLKEKLSTSPILVIADCKKMMYVQTDASEVGVGAALLQMHAGVLHPVRYLSRKLKGSEKNYSTIEIECLAIVWAVEKLSVYLYGVEFVLLTDHKPLTYIQQTRVKNARVMRWSMFLQDWAFTIKSIKGVENYLADYLSRA